MGYNAIARHGSLEVEKKPSEKPGEEEDWGDEDHCRENGMHGAPYATDVVGTASSAACLGVGRQVEAVSGPEAEENVKRWDSPLKREVVDNDTNNDQFPVRRKAGSSCHCNHSL